MIRRLNLFGGPGSGKTTTAARVFAGLKMMHYDVDLVLEWIKLWAILGQNPVSNDQSYVFYKQLKAEDTRLQKMPLIVSDSPLLLNTAYCAFYKYKACPHLTAIARQFDDDFPPLNLYIDRSVPYVQSGRYQDYEKAVEFDAFLLDFLAANLDGELIHVKVDALDEILSLVKGKIDACQSS